MQNVVHSFCTPLVHVPNGQVSTMLERSVVAEVLLRGVRAVFNMPFCREWYEKKMHAKVAYPKVRDYTGWSQVVMLFVLTGVSRTKKVSLEHLGGQSVAEHG